jgi:hypothetical protein
MDAPAIALTDLDRFAAGFPPIELAGTGGVDAEQQTHGVRHMPVSQYPR